ncbi:phosphomannomutase [bacterium]|nr:phosphomannomutase [bacterium]
MKVTVQQVMDASGVRFGTSGARGPAHDITDQVSYVYTRGFLQYLAGSKELSPGMRVAVAGDLRPSTGRIMAAVRRAVRDMGYSALNCGRIPSPAVALYGITHGIPAIMVTGSHIPADRNGIKFNKPAGEILKADEAAIRKQEVDIADDMFTGTGAFVTPAADPWPEESAARHLYMQRYLSLFPPDCLAGKKVGVYQHSAVGREIVFDILQRLGADATPLGFSESFIPVDTEAIRPEDAELAAAWSKEYGFDGIVSTDGDSDRPLVSDEHGIWLRGDVAGILTARFLGADSVSTPVSCNSAVEKSGYFRDVRRTRIGSPYVIESMNEAVARDGTAVVGYEANGGFLTNSDIPLFGSLLPALPTRDALIVLLAVFLLSVETGKPISGLLQDLPARFTCSDRLKNFPEERSAAIMNLFSSGNPKRDMRAAERVFGGLSGRCVSIDRTDGVRMTFDSEEIIHLRPSGNAPEFRCYTEAADPKRVTLLNGTCMELLLDLGGG